MPPHLQFSYKSIYLNRAYYGRYVLLITPHKTVNLSPYYAIPLSEDSTINYIEAYRTSSPLQASKVCKASSFASWIRKQKRKEQKALGKIQ